MAMSKKYINCKVHGKGQFGYVLCRHILEHGASVSVHIKREPEGEGIRRTFGQLCCDKPMNEHGADEIALICARCADHYGLTTGQSNKQKDEIADAIASSELSDEETIS